MSCVIDLFITVYYFKTSFIFYLQAFNQSNTMSATSGAGTEYLSPTLCFCGVRVVQSLIFCVMVCI